MTAAPEPRPRRPWFGGVYAAAWLLFLESPAVDAWRLLPGVRGVVGLLALVGFGVAYLAAFFRNRRQRLEGIRVPPVGQAATVLCGLGALAAATCWAVGQEGTATFVFLAVTVVLNLRRIPAVVGIAVLAGGNELLSVVVPGWTRDSSVTLSVLLAALAIAGILQVIERNAALVSAHEENARLAVAEERNRLARDLHDILGHSLTVITVKAELAQRLFDQAPDRARRELDDLERLSRDALADVRRTAEGYRELSLPVELARAKSALTAAGITARLPNSTEEVPTEIRELFAWTVREGVTNVIRHSRAETCTVSLAADAIEVRDDGVGPPDGSGSPTGERLGSGLLGLRERAAAHGATLVVRTLEPGFSLRVVAA